MTAMDEAFCALFQDLSDGVCVVGEGGRILYANGAGRKLLGVDANAEKSVSVCQSLCAHLAGRTSEDFARTCPLIASKGAMLGLTLEGSWPLVSYDWKGFSIRKHEKDTELRVRCLAWPNKPLGAEHGEIHIVLIQDVTKENELKHSKEDWRDMAAHDLRSPLTNIFGVLRVLQEVPEDRPLEKGERQLIEIGRRSCARMIELLDLYLDIAKLDANLMPVALKPMSLLDAVRACAEEQEPLTKGKGVEIAIDIDESLEVGGDRDLLPRVIHNLLNNALKFSPSGGEVSISARREADGTTVLSVRDRGPGIDPEDVPKIFDRFHQAKARREGRTKGTGLGLTFCREAMRAMKGTIGIESEPGRGSKFFLTFPPPEAPQG